MSTNLLRTARANLAALRTSAASREGSDKVVPRTAYSAVAPIHQQGEAEETLVLDARANVRPAQAVENKLVRMLQSVVLPVSHMRLTVMATMRRHC